MGVHFDVLLELVLDSLPLSQQLPNLNHVFALILGLSPLESTFEHAAEVDVALERELGVSMEVDKARNHNVDIAFGNISIGYVGDKQEVLIVFMDDCDLPVLDGETPDFVVSEVVPDIGLFEGFTPGEFGSSASLVDDIDDHQVEDLTPLHILVP